MLFHASIPADDPQRVANVIAEIWKGEAFRFPPWPGAFVAMAGDDRGSTVEVYPRGHVIVPGEHDAAARPTALQGAARQSEFHLAIATERTAQEVLEIARRESWRALRCSRGGFFEVIELWVEDALLIEVLTPEMQQDYRRNINLNTWRWTKQAEAA